MATASTTPQKNKTIRLPPPKRGQIKARILGKLVKAMDFNHFMVKPGGQGRNMGTDAVEALPSSLTPPPSAYNSDGRPTITKS